MHFALCRRTNPHHSLYDPKPPFCELFGYSTYRAKEESCDLWVGVVFYRKKLLSLLIGRCMIAFRTAAVGLVCGSSWKQGDCSSRHLHSLDECHSKSVLVLSSTRTEVDKHKWRSKVPNWSVSCYLFLAIALTVVFCNMMYHDVSNVIATGTKKSSDEKRSYDTYVAVHTQNRLKSVSHISLPDFTTLC